MGRTSNCNLIPQWKEIWRDVPVTLVFFLAMWGAPGEEQTGVMYPSTWRTKGPLWPLQMSLRFSGGMNIHSIFFSDFLLKLVGSFMLIVIRSHSEGGSPLHFFWKSLPSLKHSSIHSLLNDFSYCFPFHCGASFRFSPSLSILSTQTE